MKEIFAWILTLTSSIQWLRHSTGKTLERRRARRISLARLSMLEPHLDGQLVESGRSARRLNSSAIFQKPKENDESRRPAPRQLAMIRGTGESDLHARRVLGGLPKLGHAPRPWLPRLKPRYLYLAPLLQGALISGGGRKIRTVLEILWI